MSAQANLPELMVALWLLIGDAERGEAEKLPIAVVVVEETDSRIS
jgi:hypothetical protein